MNSNENGLVLLTGSSGFVGGAVCAELLRRARPVRCALRTAPVQTPSRCDVQVVGEIGAATDWSAALDGVEVVIHAAARVHIMRDKAANPLDEFRAVNVAGTVRLANMAAAQGVKRFVFVSSIGVNGIKTADDAAFSEADQPAPNNAYAISKWEAEQALLAIAKKTGMEVVIVRPPLVYGHGAPGNFGALIRAVQKRVPLPLRTVRNVRSMVALDNLVDFILTCATHPRAANQVFLVCDGHDLSTPSLVRGLAKAAGVPGRMLPFPVWIMRAGAAWLNRRDAAQGLLGSLRMDISKARDLLDWSPPISVEEGMRRAVQGGRHREKSL